MTISINIKITFCKINSFMIVKNNSMYKSQLHLYAINEQLENEILFYDSIRKL